MAYNELLALAFAAPYMRVCRSVRTPLCKISSTGEIEQRFRLN